MSPIPWLVIVALTAINALYVAAEFSIVAVERGAIASLARGGNARAASVLSVLEDGTVLDRYIAACQIGITLTSLVAGAYGQATIGVALAPMLEGTFHLTRLTAQSASAVTVLIVLTTFQMVLGELVPKSLALQYPERTVLATYLPTRLSASLYHAFIVLLNGSGFLLLKPFGVEPGGHQHVHSAAEIEFLLAESSRGGSLTKEVHQRLTRGLKLSSRTVRQIMTSRTDIFAIDVAATPDEIVARVIASPYSRIPVYRGTLDHIIGAVSTKELVGAFAKGKPGTLTLGPLIRPIPFVPEHLAADKLVPLLQAKHSSKAIVVDEFGGVAGLVSIDDVLGQVFGEVGDELKAPEPKAELLADGSERLPGSLSLDDLPWLAKLWYGEAATVGGHIVTKLGRLPDEGERFVLDGVHVHIVEMAKTVVKWVVVKKPDAPSEVRS